MRLQQLASKFGFSLDPSFFPWLLGTNPLKAGKGSWNFHLHKNNNVAIIAHLVYLILKMLQEF